MINRLVQIFVLSSRENEHEGEQGMARIGYARVSSKNQQLERQQIKERQAQGINLAKKKGKYKGRKPKFAATDERLLHGIELSKQGLSDAEVSKVTGINRTTFGRYKKRMLSS
jgi:DNA invertase Pin-like site-specific DNA recombinase